MGGEVWRPNDRHFRQRGPIYLRSMEEIPFPAGNHRFRHHILPSANQWIGRKTSPDIKKCSEVCRQDFEIVVTITSMGPTRTLNSTKDRHGDVGLESYVRGASAGASLVSKRAGLEKRRNSWHCRDQMRHRFRQKLWT